MPKELRRGGGAVIVGNLTKDVIYWVDQLPALDDVATVRRMTNCLGGRGCVVASTVGALGVNAILLTTLPLSVKEEVTSFLANYGVNFAGVAYDSEATRCASVIVTIGRAEQNCTSLFIGGDSRMMPQDAHISHLRQAAVAYFTTHDIDANLCLFASLGPDTRVIVNVTSYMMRQKAYREEVLRSAHVLVGNSGEFGDLCRAIGVEAPDEIFEHYHKISRLFITRGAEGVDVLERDSRAMQLPAVAASVNTPLGIGDAFAAGVVLGELRGWSALKSAQLGLWLAKASLEAETTCAPVAAIRSAELAAAGTVGASAA